MKSCRRWRDHLMEALCDELTPERRAQLDAHLASCPGCVAELAGLRATASAVDGALPPRPQAAELDVWSRIRPEMDELDRRPAARRLVLAYPAAASLAAALLALGLGLGWLIPPSSPVPVAESPGSDGTPSPVLTQPAEDRGDRHGDTDLVRFLERATPLLLAVANRRAGSTEVASFDPAAERRLAERLAADAERLARELETGGLRRQAGLVADLRVVFLQMANLPRREYRRGIEMVQATIESRALLFQLSVEEMRHL